MVPNTTGHSVGELRSHLRGSAALNLRDGAIKGINIAKKLREVQTTQLRADLKLDPGVRYLGL